MYIPKFNAVNDPALLHELMRSFSFATLVTTHDGAPFATHLPFMLDDSEGAGEHGTLIAHMARGNAQWRDFDGVREALTIFQGAHAYISPSWYEEPVSVPTWNYAVVHAYGVPCVVEDEARVREILHALVDLHEGSFEEPWPMELPDDYLRKMMGAIVAFEIPIARLEGKFKLSQNRSPADRHGVIEHLAASPDPDAQAVAALMHEHPGSTHS
jgi:transcriptional regulator